MYPSILAEHCIREYTQAIEADPASVFPLLCPMREHEWIPGWRARMIHSCSGVAEAGAVFATPSEAGETLWIVTAYEAPRRIQFTRFQADGVVVLIDLTLQPDGEACSRVHIRYALTAAMPSTTSAVRDFTPDCWKRMMTQWQNRMNAFLAGQRTRSP